MTDSMLLLLNRFSFFHLCFSLESQEDVWDNLCVTVVACLLCDAFDMVEYPFFFFCTGRLARHKSKHETSMSCEIMVVYPKQLPSS